MTTAPMTLSDLLDWHARRLGWLTRDNPSLIERWGRWYRPGCGSRTDHPILPPTLDAIAELLPPGWTWERWGGGEWIALPPGTNTKLIHIPDTGDEKHDRALLAKLAWEQEATK